MLENFTFKFMGKSLLVLLFSITLITAYSQRKKISTTSTFKESRNVFYAEFLGNGFFPSINYDTRLKNNFGIRVGVGYSFSLLFNYKALSIPVMGNFLFGKNGHYFELGAGIIYFTNANDVFDEGFNKIAGTLSFMYRNQPVDGGIMWKIGLTPILTLDKVFPYYGGVSLGYCW
ncbi:MAG: hypothetical protein IPM42_12210 [Saprospiraceae bacterium]|nr:hypothetical protein [Saprospiraceae bacterium]